MRTLITKLAWLVFLLFLFTSCEQNDETPDLTPKQPEKGFISFSTDHQTILTTAINPEIRRVRFEVESNTDLTRLVPSFEVPQGYRVMLEGVEQVSGNAVVDFSKPVKYEIVDAENRKGEWEVSAELLRKKILIDASHDGGVWWFPQGEHTGFNPESYHQGKAFADILRSKGFEVTELGRGGNLKEEQFFGSYIVIRVIGFQPYSDEDLRVYQKLVKRGMNLVFFTDHMKNDSRDELGELLGLKFAGNANGNVSRFETHLITSGLTSLKYIAGSVLTNAEENKSIKILGWLGENDYADLDMDGVRDAGEDFAPPVMGILDFPNSKVFFIGDSNGLQIMPQPFIDNLVEWMKH